MSPDLEVYERLGSALALLEMLTEHPEPEIDGWGRQSMVRLTVPESMYRRVRHVIAEAETRRRANLAATARIAAEMAQVRFAGESAAVHSDEDPEAPAELPDHLRRLMATPPAGSGALAGEVRAEL